MVKNQMDPTLLAHYVDLPRWRVRRHLKPQVFIKLSVELRRRYADLFRITVEQLEQVPDEPDLDIDELDRSQEEQG